MPNWRRNTLPSAPAATRDAVSRALARSSTLRTSSRPYLTTPGQVGVAGPQPRHWRRRLWHGFDVHLALPVGPVSILDHHGDRTAHGPTVPHAGHDLHAVVFDLLAPAATVALLAAGEVDVDVLGQHGQPSRQVLDEDRELRTVRFARRDHAQVTQAHTDSRRAAAYASIGAAWPVQRSNARAAWCSNMPNPFSARAPACRAATMKPVSGGL